MEEQILSKKTHGCVWMKKCVSRELSSRELTLYYYYFIIIMMMFTFIGLSSLSEAEGGERGGSQ